MVYVPASVVAPHMVDGKYWGRSDKSKSVLSDARVEDLMSRRLSGASDFEARVRSILPRGTWTGLSLALLVEPITNALLGRWTAALDVSRLRTLLGESFETYEGFGFEELSDPQPLPHGISMKAQGHFSTLSSASIELVLLERPAQILLTSSSPNLSKVLESAGQYVHHHALDFKLVVHLVTGVIRVAEEMSLVVDHVGEWRMGLAVSSLAGHRVYDRLMAGTALPPVFLENEYFASTVTTAKDLKDQKEDLALGLLGPLARGLGVEDSMRDRIREQDGGG